MKKIILILAVQLLHVAVEGAPAGAIAASGAVATSSSGGGSFLPFLSFEKGNVGVNFGGYHASAGLGGLLTGNAAHGGLQASAGTPTGQKAVAGLGGSAHGEAGTSGSLYAGATAGNGYSAGAGLSGSSSSSGVSGVKFAGSSAGNVGGAVHKTVVTEEKPQTYIDVTPEQTATIYKTKTKIRTRTHPHHLRRKVYTSYYTDYAPIVPAAYVQEPEPATIEVHGGAHAESYVEPSFVKSVEKHKYKHKQIVVEKPVESVETVYVEKPVEVVQYQKPVEVVQYQKPVEVVHYKKPVRVVEAEPVSYGGSASAAASSAFASAEVQYQKPVEVVQYQKPVEVVHYQKPVRVVEVEPVSYGGGSSAAAGSASATAGGYGGASASSAASSAAASSGHRGAGGASLGYSASFSHRNNGQLIRDIFNIPIATLGAVSNLASNAVKNNSFSFSKSLSASYAGR